jgi:hypothetical protein
VISKLSIGKSLIPETAVLESVLGRDDVIVEENLDSRDGGMEPTNHVYRPDVTKMLRYMVNDFSEKKPGGVGPGMGSQLTNIIALLPSNRPLKCANTQYIADQCIRLLASVTMPSKHIGDETYANVDKRTRAAMKPKTIVAPAPVAPSVSIAPKVKKEEIFDPVEYYSKK